MAHSSMYYTNGGLYFKRHLDGAVEVIHKANNMSIMFKAEEWARVMAAVSDAGETRDKVKEAYSFHLRRKEDG